MLTTHLDTPKQARDKGTLDEKVERFVRPRDSNELEWHSLELEVAAKTMVKRDG
jgi:hypothetical protein